MLVFLLGQVATEALSPGYTSAGATAILAAVVVWLAKAYRDDMKERAAASLTSHEKIATEYTTSTERMQEKFLTALDRKAELVEDLRVAVAKLADGLADHLGGKNK